MFRRLMAVLLIGVLSIAVNAQNDSFCTSMAEFSNGAQDKQEISVALTTDWKTFNKACQHNDIPSGITFCHWLIDNTSGEFMRINVDRAIKCLSRDSATVLPSELDVIYATGRFSRSALEGIDSNIQVTVEYSFGIEGETPLLRISAVKTE